jgi:hypothetical protein
VDKDRNAKVAWSLAKSKAPLQQGDPYILPDQLRVANSSVVVAQVGYSDSPMLGYALTGRISMSEVTYARASRQVSGVTCSASDC